MGIRHNAFTYKCDNVNVTVTEDTNNNNLVFLLFRGDDDEYKSQFAGPSGTFLSNYATLEETIASRLPEMLDTYNNTNFVWNKYKKNFLGTKKKKFEKQFVTYSEFPLSDNLTLRLYESQNESNLDVIRKFCLYDKNSGCEYLVDTEMGDLEKFEPVENKIKSDGEIWSKMFDEEIINCIFDEFKNVKAYVDKVANGDNEYGILEYEDNTYCYYSFIDGSYTFEKHDDVASCYKKMSDTVNNILKKQKDSGANKLLRTAINNCRTHLAKDKEALFLAEMGALRGIMMMSKIVDVETLKNTIPEELAIDMFFQKFSTIVNK